MSKTLYPPLTDTEDFDKASQGCLESLSPCVIYSREDPPSRIVWDNDAFSFLENDCPKTANISLWRQGQLCYKQGLFEVIKDRIYQIRGLDISNISFVEGDEGLIVIDPLTSYECAEAAMKLYHHNRPSKPIKGLVYTHSHGDHFGGAGAVLPEGWKEQGIKVFAPTGFLENAVRENVYAGNAMTRRAVYMYGDRIPKGPAGLIGCGLGTTTSTGQVALVNPTDVIEQSFTEHDVAGLKLKFQLTPGTEAPAEMNIHFPGLNALCMAENSSHNLHNIQTLRGALVRDARMWARYLDESISKFTGAATDPPTDVLFNSHHWPTWGADKVRDILISQRDMYTYLHDQTLRMLNVGMTGLEIAENFVLPESLETKWNLRGYYGSVSHNVKGIYTRYMGWYDGNPAHLWEHPPVQAGKRYVDCIGGTHAALEKARTFKEEGDLRFAATLLSHVVFADQDSKVAREELAAVFTELGQGAENGTWRNEYLCAALELTGAIQPTLLKISPESMIALNLVELVDSVAITIDGPKAAQHGSFSIELQVPDIGSGTGYLMSLSNGALTHREVEYEAFSEFSTDTATLTLWPTHEQLVAMLHDKNADLDTQGIKWTGNEKVLAEFFGLVTDQDPGFAIVTPEKPTTW